MIKKCLVCDNQISPFIDFGPMPIANGFVAQKGTHQYSYNMSVAFCESCYMVQLMEQPDREMMFHENYAFYSSTSKHMAAHFEQFANEVISDYGLTKDSYVVEIGSNDGIMLKHFAKQGIGHIGIEPSKNVAEMAEKQGINTISCFFDENLQIYRKADVILAANVIAHIADIHSVMRGIKNLLEDDGVFIFEDPYMGDLLAKTSYDQIYDEHAFFFSALSISSLAKAHGMELVDAVPQETHGGSMRYTLARSGVMPINPRVFLLLEEESLIGLDKIEIYQLFKKNVEASRDSLVLLLNQIKAGGGNIVGYAATAKSATIINYCQIGRYLDFICDTTPIKQGKFSPGAELPVVSYENFKDYPPTHALLFAWNHSKEIMEKERDFKGKWITYVPEVRVS